MDEYPEIILRIKVTPRAKRNELTQILADGTLKVRITAPPVEGKANLALVQFLAEIFRVSSSKIELVSGMRRREKVVSITGIDPKTVQTRILEVIGQKPS